MANYLNRFGYHPKDLLRIMDRVERNDQNYPSLKLKSLSFITTLLKAKPDSTKLEYYGTQKQNL